ncbi:MAG: ABC transporter ATP-binding protein [Myxococcota bacterium]|nr:ABC transporter ATP-binding protein [Myxococcales bacterium]
MTREAEEHVVVVENVTKDVRPGLGLRRKRILHDVSFTVQRGEIFGFVGPNGAGKTTTLKVLMGLIRATSGRARILGHEVGATAFRREIGFLPEHPTFYDYLTGREILHFYAKLSGLSAAERDARVALLLDWVGLARAADDRLRTYSKGMVQRVGIAQALVHDPSVVFLDEPMSGLDPIGRKEIRDLVLRLREEGKTVFMNTHILSDMEMVCDRVAIIIGGRIRYQGRIEEYLRTDEHEVDVALTGVSPDLAAALEEAFEVELRGVRERIELRVPEKATERLLRLAMDAGARIVSVQPHRPSLESVFLTAVRDAERGAVAASALQQEETR